MSKRGADKQLTQLNADEEEIDAAAAPPKPAPFAGFNAFGASPAATTTTTTDSASSAPKPYANFSFSGSAPSSFSFQTPTSSTTESSTTAFPSFSQAKTGDTTTQQSSTFSFKTSADPPKTSGPSFSFPPAMKNPEGFAHKPPVTSSPLAFSFKAATEDTTDSTATAKPTPSSSSSSDGLEKRTTEYWRHLRSLNLSLQRKINADLQLDGFADLSNAIEQYSTQRQDILAMFDDVVKAGAAAAGPKASMAAPTMPASGFTFKPTDFSFKPTVSSGDKVSNPTFTFGSIGSSTNSLKTDDGTPKPFSFGTTPSQGSTTPKLSFAFGPSTTTAASPTNFSFSGLNSSVTAPPTSSAFSAPFTFNLGASPFIPMTKTEDNGEGASKDDDDESPPGEEGFSGARTNAALVQTGEGEEGEIALAEISKCKVYRLDSEKGSWTDVGIGNLKLNEHKESKKKRFLARSEGSGRILINAHAIPNMNIRADQKAHSIMLTLPDETGKPVTYSIRIGKDKDAESFAVEFAKHTKE
ncbi:hypothetical protein BC936DRAFT_144587 [Jimgerdemannia flammicorona]|uniref:RanBD1 domain-containing protein n=1 Tax=Jimgerdemannia flammicorona TaxID=994334 RepID=A0A433DC87_9FUNG|nr:hypothetical protein BC936DRAFT_144587 [Jimgerdemannia flammicorona]